MKRLSLVVAVVVVLVALGLFASIVSQGFEELSRAEAERHQLEQERARLEERIQDLQATLEAVNSSPDAVESLARHDLGWVRPGETVVIIATPPPQPAPVALTDPVPTPILTLPD